jgi:uncharacterized FlaG/YvyC family protein
MQVGISNINTEKIYSLMVNHINTGRKDVSTEQTLTLDQMKQIVKKEYPGIAMESVEQNIDKIKQLTRLIDREVRLSVNKDINRIIISIVEKGTDKVIKEIPCDEIQKLDLYLKNVIDALNG